MVKLNTKIEEQLWLDIYAAQFNKKSPDGFLSVHSSLCADFADEAVLEYRDRIGLCDSVMETLKADMVSGEQRRVGNVLVIKTHDGKFIEFPFDS